MLTGISRGSPCVRTSLSAFKPENVLLPGCGIPAAAFARRESTNDRGPTKGPYHRVAPRILRAETSGRIQSTQFKQS